MAYGTKEIANLKSNLPSELSVLDREELINDPEFMDVMRMLFGDEVIMPLFAGTNEFGQAVEIMTAEEAKELRIAHEDLDDGDLIAKRWGERRSAVATSINGRRICNALYHRAYKGSPPEFYNEASRKIEPIGMPGYFPSFAEAYHNRLTPIILEIASELTDIAGILEVGARSSSQDDVDAARMATAVVNKWNESKKITTHKWKTSIMAPTFGNWLTKIYWDPKAWATKKLEDGTIERGQFGDVEIEVDFDDRLYTPLNCEKLDDADWMIHETKWTLSRMEREFPGAVLFLKNNQVGKDVLNENKDHHQWHWLDTNIDYDSDILEMGSDVMYHSSMAMSQAWNGERISEVAEAYPYRIYDCYERCYNQDYGEYWHRTVICQGIILKHEPYLPLDEFGEPMTDEFGMTMTWDHPFVIGKYQEVPGEMRGQGAMHSLLPQGKFLTFLDGLLAMSVVNSSFEMMAFPMDELSDPIYQMGLIAIGYTGGQPPTFHSPSSVVEQIKRSIEYYENRLERTVMRPDVTRGESPGNRSGKAISMLTEEARGATDIIRFGTNVHWEEAYFKMLKLAQMMYDEERIVGIDEEDIVGAVAFKGADIANLGDVRVVLGTLWGVPRSQRMQRAMALMERGIISQDEAKRAIRGGVGSEIVTDAEIQERESKRIINLIVKMDEMEAAQISQEITAMREEAKRVAGEKAKVAKDPNILAHALSEARASVMSDHDIGVEEFHEPIAVHLQMLNRFMSTEPGRKLPEPNKELLLHRREMCQAKVDQLMAMAQQMQSAPAGG